ncbi:hypothetical protein TNCV_1836201, partial [Trichonephila clavipes]
MNDSHHLNGARRSRVVFNFPGTLGTSNCGVPSHYFQNLPPLLSVLTLPVLVREGFSLNSMMLFLFFVFLKDKGKSFHYPPPMDPPCPGLATDTAVRKESDM